MKNDKPRHRRDRLAAIISWLEIEFIHYDCGICGGPGLAPIGVIIAHTREHNRCAKARARRILRAVPNLEIP